LSERILSYSSDYLIGATLGVLGYNVLVDVDVGWHTFILHQRPWRLDQS
jgi:hypothetical protein